MAPERLAVDKDGDIWANYGGEWVCAAVLTPEDIATARTGYHPDRHGPVTYYEPRPDTEIPQLIIRAPRKLTRKAQRQLRQRIQEAIATQRPRVMREDDHHG